MIDDYLQPTQPVVSDEERGRQVILENEAVIQQFLSQPHITQLFKDFKDEDGNPVPPSLKQIHLHLHTPKGSLLDGFARIDDLMPLSREYGMPAVGVSEHGTMASHFDFYHAANKAGIKPIMGMEAYVTPNHKWKKVDFDRVFYIMENYGTEEEPSIHPKLFHMSAERMQAEGYTNVLEIKDSSVAKTMARIVESYFIREIKHEYAQREEKAPNQAAIKKEVTRRKTASTRQGLRFCVKEKTQVRDLFTWRPHNNNHLLLIARTQEGYSNMLKLCSTGFLEGFYRKPRVDPHLLKKHGKGLIATSACLGSDINQCLLLGRDRVAKNLIKFYDKIFDEFYLEIQPSEQPEQHYVNKRLKEFSKEMNIPLICTTDVHMLKKEEKSLHATITTIGKSEDTDGISVYDSCYFMSTEEILGKGIPIEAVMNTMEVASKCNVTLADDSIKFPVYDVPEGETFDSYLRQLSSEALFNYALSKNIDISLYMERLNYELEVVANKNISAYFIIVWDYIKFARDRSILVGPGRGSAAGSLISFLLRITNLDPIKYDLLFSRFINPERPGFPDVDSDFDDKRRHEVIEYVTNKYGADRVSQIGTFSMLNTKSVLKDVGRSLGIDHVEINSMNKFVPVHQGKSPTVDECLTLVPEFEAYEQKYPELFKTAIKIQGMPRTSSVHACGIMITPTPIDDFVPLTAGKNGERVSQYDGPSLEKSGFIKFDFLGLKNLSVINIARQLVKERHGIDIDPDALEPDDDVVFSTIGNGKTQGIFQLESSGMTKVFTGLDRVDFESLIAGVSLYRPGPMAHIPEYQQRANGYKEVSYFHEDANEVLSTTFGIMIYQEQLMRLAGVFGGYSEGAQDTLRKATGKKSQEVMNKVLPELKEAVINNGYHETTADKLVELIEPFVGYGLQNV